MQLQWIILTMIHVFLNCNAQLTLLATTHRIRLEKYKGYVNAVILHFKVPADVNFACFKFRAEEVTLSLFSCKVQDITISLKHGSPPVINPDGAKFPNGFITEGRSKIYSATFKSDNAFKYINITSPMAGSYFVAAFLSYTDPNKEGIVQEGLTPDCMTFLYSDFYVRQKQPSANVITWDKDLHILLETNATRLYKFYVPDVADTAIFSLKNIQFCLNCSELQIKMQAHTIPAVNNTLYDVQLKREEYNEKTFLLYFKTIENSWYYLSFLFNETNLRDSDPKNYGEFLFKVKYLSSFINVSEVNDTKKEILVKAEVIQETEPLTLHKELENNSVLFKHSIIRSYQSTYLNDSTSYKQYNLIRDGRSESFMYFFNLHPNADSKPPFVLNITNQEMYILKFNLNPNLDIGGTLQFGLAFKPIVKGKGKIRVFEEPKNQKIVACFTNKAVAVPTWPDQCKQAHGDFKAPIVINGTVASSTAYIPYPEPGEWYATFKLFCGACEKCVCSQNCRQLKNNCFHLCESNCEHYEDCDMCVENCEQSVFKKTECSGCNCEGPCQRSDATCNSSVVFDIGSHPCISGGCGANGKCMYLVSEGLAYSVCICTNRFKGWGCTDASDTASHVMVLMELLLLVLSNMMFLPAVYVAYRRGYYLEAIIYFAACFFSTFYHACDAGENIYSYCLTQLSALQFSDFFCGLYSIWVTIIAMAYLPDPIPSICHIAGALLLSFFTAIDKTALWVFALPFLTGMLILIISWFMKYKKMSRSFPSKRYLYVIFPTGLVIVGVGLLMYALLQTQSNYKYLHSMWHILMAVSIIILLPKKETFLPPSLETMESTE